MLCGVHSAIHGLRGVFGIIYIVVVSGKAVSDRLSAVKRPIRVVIVSSTGSHNQP